MPDEPLPTAPSSPSSSSTSETSLNSPIDPWLEYLIGKKINAARYLAKIAKGQIPLADQQSRDRFADTLIAEPARLGRFIALQQASTTRGDSVRRIVSEFAETFILRHGIIQLPVPVDSIAFHHSVMAWLEQIPQRPLKPADMNYLFVVIHFGCQKGLLDFHASLDLLTDAVRKPVKVRAKDKQSVKPNATPLNVLLTASLATPVLAALVAQAEAYEIQTKEGERQLRSQESEIVQLKATCAEFETTIDGLRRDVDLQKELCVAGDKKVAGLERDIVDLGDGWQHKLEEARGRIRGVLQGQLKRWLQTALDAARSNPPFIKAVEERLEDALRAIDGELQWLQRVD